MLEAEVLNRVKLEAANKGIRLWRNNVGCVREKESGRFYRFGILNESEAVNKKIKSSDLIGIKKILITQDMVGTHIGQFICREIKRSDWKYNINDERECAQKAFIDLVNSMGGDAQFANDIGTL